jgi:uncharacterized membrane protein YkvA (DUF1232 family)
MGLCILYIVSPIDLLPEAFLGPFGLIDDFVAGLVLLVPLFSQMGGMFGTTTKSEGGIFGIFGGGKKK